MSFMDPKEPKYTYRVGYKPNPTYEGAWHAKLKPGIHGVFDTRAEAQEAAAKCKGYFNTESRSQPKMVDGKLTDNIVTTMHDNVIVWVDEFRDGVLVEKDPPKIEPSKKVA